MSNIKVQGNVSGTGTLTFAAPNTNSNRTLTLPDETGTVLSSVSDLTTQTKAALNASNGAPIYACRAWVNFNGTGTVAIRASGNVTSITDNGTGDYTVNFTTAMPDANYSVVAGSNGRSTDTTPDVGVTVGVGATTVSGSVATGTRIVIGNPSSSEDTAVVTVAIFR